MTWDQIKEVEQESFAIIGHHSHSHDYLIDVSEEDFIKDIEIANKIFTEKIGYIPSLFSSIWRIFRIYEAIYFKKFYICIWSTFRCY